MTGTEQPSWVSLTTEIGGSVKISVGIANPFKTHTENRTEPNIQPTIVHSNQTNRPGHSDWDYLLIGSLDSDTDVPVYGQNIDSRTGMKPRLPIVTTIP